MNFYISIDKMDITTTKKKYYSLHIDFIPRLKILYGLIHACGTLLKQMYPKC